MKTENYKKAFIELVESFVKRFYKEIYKEEAYNTDYRVIGSDDIVGLSTICVNEELYFNIDEIYVAEINQIPMVVVENRYYDRIEGLTSFNLWHYWKKGTIEIEKRNIEKTTRSNNAVKEVQE